MPMPIKMGVWCYWRFIKSGDEDDRTWAMGWPNDAGLGLVRMGGWNGDKYGGPIVDPSEIEVRQE